MISTFTWPFSRSELTAGLRRYLAANRDYPERLRWTILSTADELFRAAAIGQAESR